MYAVFPTDGSSLTFGIQFYLNATTQAYAGWNMASWIVHELPARVAAEFPVESRAAGILGHSMGGHGALTLGLKHPGIYRSVSAFAPICAPSQVPWGQKAFAAYLGPETIDGRRDPSINVAPWRAHDACALIEDGARFNVAPWIDQGLADPYLDSQLRPDLLETACAAASQPVVLRRHAGYDHGYWFVQSFVAEQLEFHARNLVGAG